MLSFTIYIILWGTLQFLIIIHKIYSCFPILDYESKQVKERMYIRGGLIMKITINEQI